MAISMRVKSEIVGQQSRQCMNQMTAARPTLLLLSPLQPRPKPAAHFP
jgi:hypothetical protein